MKERLQPYEKRLSKTYQGHNANQRHYKPFQAHFMNIGLRRGGANPAPNGQTAPGHREDDERNQRGNIGQELTKGGRKDGARN